MNYGRERIVLVTGASRGAGRGISIALGATGARVYLTGRPEADSNSNLAGTLLETAQLVTNAGGEGIALYCDHSSDEQTQSALSEIQKEHGRLDILVNNATDIDDAITDSGPFWEKPISLCNLLDVGLRSHYLTTWHAAPLLITDGGGLVVNTSSFGGRIYMHGPAYGAGKAGVDKMAHDMAVDFKPFEVAVISLWMGLLLTERTKRVLENDQDSYQNLLDSAETPEFTGRIINALADDKDLHKLSGKVLIGAELARQYSIVDINGRIPPSHRAIFGNPTEFGDTIVQ